MSLNSASAANGVASGGAVKRVKDIELQFKHVPTEYGGCCGWAGALWLVVVVLRARAIANFVLDIVLIQTMFDDPFVQRDVFFAFAAFAAAELLLFTIELFVGLRTLWRGRIHAIFFDSVAASISKLSYSRFNILSRKLKSDCSVGERMVFFINDQANVQAWLSYVCISLPLAVTLCVLVSLREAERSSAGLEVQVGEIVDVVLKLILSLIDAVVMVVCTGLWPIARFLIAKKPLSAWAERRVRRRLHKLYPDVVGALSGRAPGVPAAPDDDWTESEDLVETLQRSSSRAASDLVDAKNSAETKLDTTLKQTQGNVDRAVDAANSAVADVRGKLSLKF